METGESVKGSPRRFVVSDEVREKLPDGLVGSWSVGPHPRSFRCVVCGHEDVLDSGVEVAVCFISQPEISGAVLIHAKCGESAIWRYAPKSLSVERHALVRRPLLLPSCVLVIVLESQLLEITPNGLDGRSLPLSHALASGFEQVFSDPFESQPAWTGLWNLQLNVVQGTSLLTPNDSRLESHHGVIPPGSSEWLNAAREEREVLILLGTGALLTDDDFFLQIERLVNLGLLVAARVRVSWDVGN